jgi:hypothetical protein
VLGFTAHVIVAADVDQAWLDGQLCRWQLSEAFLPPFLGTLAARVGCRVDGIDLLALAGVRRRVRRRSPSPRKITITQGYAVRVVTAPTSARGARAAVS